MGNKNCVENEGWQKNQERLKKKWETQRKEKENEYYKNPIICKHCNNPIPYSNDLRNRAFCNSSCSASFNNVRKEKQEKERKKCTNCGIKINKGSKKYCSKKCEMIFKFDKYIKNWKSGKISGKCGDSISPNIKRYIFEKFESKCTKCGWSKVNPYTGLIPLHVDHTDGNSRNNKEENLDLICPSCHSLTGNYGALNKGKSKREYRNKWRHKYKELMGV